MSCECVCIIQSDHPLPKCNYDAIADNLAMHFPCAPAYELSSTRALQQYKKASAGGKKKPVLQSGHIQGKLPTQIQTFASAVPGAEKKPTLAFQLTCGPPVWSVKAECASSSHPTTAVCSSLCATRLARLLAPTCD